MSTIIVFVIIVMMMMMIIIMKIAEIKAGVLLLSY